MDIRDCNDEKIGIQLRTIPLVSMDMGHNKVSDTVGDYIIRKEDPNATFIRDLFTLTTKEVIDKWYGGEENALDLLSQLDEIRKNPSE